MGLRHHLQCAAEQCGKCKASHALWEIWNEYVAKIGFFVEKATSELSEMRFCWLMWRFYTRIMCPKLVYLQDKGYFCKVIKQKHDEERGKV